MYKSHTSILHIILPMSYIIIYYNKLQLRCIISYVPRTVFLEILHRYEYHMSTKLAI